MWRETATARRPGKEYPGFHPQTIIHSDERYKQDIQKGQGSRERAGFCDPEEALNHFQVLIW